MDHEPRLEPGFVYPEYDMRITATYQRSKHACAGVETELYGDRVDVALLAYETILAGRRCGIPINGNVHVGQSFEVLGPLVLGEPLGVRGVVESVNEVARGRIIESVFEFSRRDGSIALRTVRRGLQPSPTPTATSSSKSAETSPIGGFSVLCRKQLEPAKVAEYTVEAENLIHSDPEVARSFGFRAPIAAGVMAISFMTEAIFREGNPEVLSMDVAFRRPMFWDEQLTIEAARTGADERVAALRVVDGDGKTLNTAEIRVLTFAA